MPRKRAKPRSESEATTTAMLAADPHNPREITPTAAKGLSASLAEFGDLAGIVFNTRTQQLVCGHQRLGRIRQKYGELPIVDGAITTPDGHIFHVRQVDWPIAKQRAANIAANHQGLQGAFTAELELQLAEVKQSSSDLYDDLLLDQLRAAPATSETPPATISVPRVVYQIVVECADEAARQALVAHLRAHNHKYSTL